MIDINSDTTLHVVAGGIVAVFGAWCFGAALVYAPTAACGWLFLACMVPAGIIARWIIENIL
jgi:hypothetical protein